jgi:hypothetical protein
VFADSLSNRIHFMLTRFYAVKTSQLNKQLAEWLVYSDSSSKHYHLLLLLPLGHLCSRNNNLPYNPSFLHSLHSFVDCNSSFLHSIWVGSWCLVLLGNKLFPVWLFLYLLPILFAIRWFPSFIIAWCFIAAWLQF